MDDVNDLPDDVRELAENHDYTGDEILLVVSTDDWAGICGPGVDGRYCEDAPFAFVTTGDTPPTDTVADMFAIKFNTYTDTVFERVTDAEEPLEEIRDMDMENIIY